jgi:hypothetical protein
VRLTVNLALHPAVQSLRPWLTAHQLHMVRKGCQRYDCTETHGLVSTYLGRPCSAIREHIIMMMMLTHGFCKAACHSHINLVCLKTVRLAWIYCTKDFVDNLSNAAHVVGDTLFMKVFDKHPIVPMAMS